MKDKIDGEPDVRSRAELFDILKEYQISLVKASLENQVQLTPVHQRVITQTQQFKCALQDGENADHRYLPQFDENVYKLTFS